MTSFVEVERLIKVTDISARTSRNVNSFFILLSSIFDKKQPFSITLLYD